MGIMLNLIKRIEAVRVIAPLTLYPQWKRQQACHRAIQIGLNIAVGVGASYFQRKHTVQIA